MDDVKRQIAMELLKIISGSEAQDSLEIGTPGRGGCVKVYGNYADKKAFAEKIEAAFAMRELAGRKIEFETVKQ